VPDIVADLSQKRRPHQRLIGFAAQTGDILPPALDKLRRKGLDAIVANPIDVAGSGFGGNSNQAVLLTKAGDRFTIPPCTKLEMAHQIWDALVSIGF
jgi:phosphopantothenoylcysteine decarboxylase/phosphopantothenate--cysteine ligase